jgi:DNA-binding Lrp family transcriptional regulator
MSFVKIVILSSAGSGAVLPIQGAGGWSRHKGHVGERPSLGTVDDLDRRILRLLREDGRATNRAMGQRLGLTEGAIRRRVAQLSEQGVLLRYTIIARPLGPDGLVLIRCRPGATEQVVGRMRQIADDLFETSGEYDLAASVAADTMEGFNQLLDRIRGLPGVEKNDTLIRLTRFLGDAPGEGKGRSARSSPRRRRR